MHSKKLCLNSLFFLLYYLLDHVSIYIVYEFLCFTASHAKTVGPRNLIFGRITDLERKRMIFYKSRSKVKGQGQKSAKMSFLGTEVRQGPDQDQGYFWQHANYFWHLAKCCTITIITIWEYWQGARVAGKVPKLKRVPGRSVARQRDASCTSPSILHISQSVYPPHGQWPAPSGSWRVDYCE